MALFFRYYILPEYLTEKSMKTKNTKKIRNRVGDQQYPRTAKFPFIVC